jgi:uncharacterized protein
MSEVFADTFYFVALLNPSDSAFQRAHVATSTQRSKLVTTRWVLAELGNMLSKPPMRAAFSNTLEALTFDPSVVIVDDDKRWFAEGVELYAARLDKEWSLTDCISFAVMKDRGITEALTGDHHFEQAGFRAVLKSGQ